MTVIAGETSPQAPPANVVDAEALARNIVQGVFANLPVQSAPVQQAAAVSAFRAKADELLKNERIDKDVMPVMLDLIEAMKGDLSREQKAEAMQAAQAASTQAIHSELGRMVERYAKTSGNPELVRKLSPSIVKDAIDDYNGNPSLVRKYQSDGSIDWNKMDESVVAYISKWAPGTAGDTSEKKPAGGPAMKNEAPAGAPDGGRQLDRDSLNEVQAEIYNSQVSFGIKQAGMTREAAEKRALENINKAEQKMKAAKR